MPRKALDGRPITAGISGFKSYSTTRKEVPEKPIPVLTPAELLIQLRALSEVLNTAEVAEALRLIQEHIENTNNPHRTDLSAFTNEVADVLYQAYLDQGGTGSKEFYLQCLFQTLRIASLDEMKDPKNENLLISIKGANQYIKEHEKDPEAHADLFEKIFPGEAPSYDPTFAVYATVGMSNYFIQTVIGGLNDTETNPPPSTTDQVSEENSLDICSCVGPDGRVQFSGYRDYSGIDYSTGTATIACFGRRTNEIEDSEGFSAAKTINCKIEQAVDVLSPEASTNNVFTVATGCDTGPRPHTVYLPDVVIDYGQEKTFSVYAKSVNCRYLAITWKDMTGSDVTVNAIYDLEQNACMIVNDLTRYKVNIVELAGGWYRCEFTISHPIGQITDLNMIFFKEKTDDFSFQGQDEICGYLWGLQYEVGPCASPYLPTRGKTRTREAIGYVIPCDEEWWESSAATLHIDWVNVGQYHDENIIRPVMTIVDDNNNNVLTVHSRNDGTLEILRYANLEVEGVGFLPVVIYQDIFEYDTRRWLQLTHGIDNLQIIDRFNETNGLNLNTPANWTPGTKIYIGSDPQGNALEGYIRSLVIYPRRATVEEAVFMNGEEIHG